MSNFGLMCNVGLHVGAYNISGISNVAMMNLEKEVRDRNVFGVNGKTRKAGIETATIVAAGFLDTTIDVARLYWATTVPVSLYLPATGLVPVAAGDRAFFFNALEPGFARGGAMSDDGKFQFQAQTGPSGDKTGVGYVLNPGTTAVTTDGGTTGLHLTGVSSSQYLYALLHVEEVSAGDSIVVTIESSADDTFASPTTQITFASKSAIGYEYATKVAGPITDAYWRAYHNVTGTDVSIKYAVALAIQ